MKYQIVPCTITQTVSHCCSLSLIHKLSLSLSLKTLLIIIQQRHQLLALVYETSVQLATERSVCCHRWWTLLLRTSLSLVALS